MSKDNFPPGQRVAKSGKYECACCGSDGLALAFQSIAGIVHANQPASALQPLNIALIALSTLPKSIEILQEGQTFPPCANCKKLLPAGMDLTGWNYLGPASTSPPPPPPPPPATPAVAQQIPAKPRTPAKTPPPPGDRIHFRCPKCQKRIFTARRDAGKICKCTGCRTSLRVPSGAGSARPKVPPVPSPMVTATPPQPALKPRGVKKHPPRRFKVWFRYGEVDQNAAASAVRAWVDQQSAAGVEFDADLTGSTEFEVQSSVASNFPGLSLLQMQEIESETPFDVQAKMELRMDKENPDELFVDDNVAIFPVW